MAKLIDGSRVFGSLTVDNAIIAACGGSAFQNIYPLTGSGAGTFTLPLGLQVPGAKFKATIIGGGGGGAGSTAATAGSTGGGGGSGGVVVVYFTIVSEVYTITYTIGAFGTAGAVNIAGNAGSASSLTYNGVTYTAGGGAGGTRSATATIAAGGTATGGTLNLVGTDGGASGVSSAFTYWGYGGDTPLGYGRGGFGGGPTSATGAGVAGLGYGAGGGGAHSSSTTGYAGAAGTVGVIILEY